jgi:hypothetical protein
MARKTYVARDPIALSATVVLWLYLMIVAQVVSLACEAYRYSVLRQLPPDTPLGFFESPPGLEPMETTTGLVAIPMAIVMVVSSILTLKWIYRVTMNSHALAQGVRVDRHVGRAQRSSVDTVDPVVDPHRASPERSTVHDTGRGRVQQRLRFLNSVQAQGNGPSMCRDGRSASGSCSQVSTSISRRLGR